MEESNYRAQVGYVQDNVKNLSFETRLAIYTLVREIDGAVIDNYAQNVSHVRLDRLDPKTLSAVVGLVQLERERLNRPAGAPAKFSSSISGE